jgi:hypothetical protein
MKKEVVKESPRWTHSLKYKMYKDEKVDDKPGRTKNLLIHT